MSEGYIVPLERGVGGAGGGGGGDELKLSWRVTKKGNSPFLV